MSRHLGRLSWIAVGALVVIAISVVGCGGGGSKGANGGMGGSGGSAGAAGGITGSGGSAGAAGGITGSGGSAGAAGGGIGGAVGTGGQGGSAGDAGGGGGGGAAGIGGAGGTAGGNGGRGVGGNGGIGGTAVVNCGAGGFIGASGALISDGGFECPIVPKGGFSSYSVGQQFFGWTVVGAGSVSPLSGGYVNGSYSWPAHSGAQTLDLTGNGSNSVTGVSQVITTVPGTTYHLSFWVGNLAAPGTVWGTSSTVNVTINGAQALVAANTDGVGSTVIVWRQFTLDFAATTTATTIAFINGDPTTDNSNLLDDVTLN